MTGRTNWFRKERKEGERCPAIPGSGIEPRSKKKPGSKPTFQLGSGPKVRLSSPLFVPAKVKEEDAMLGEILGC